MSMLTLAISFLTTSNLLWFLGLTFQVRMQYCSLQHQTLLLLPVTSTTGGCFWFGSVSLFFLELFLHWSPEHIGHLPTWAVHLSVSYLFAFSYCSWGSQGKNTEVVCHSLLWWTTFSQNSPLWPIHLGWPYTAWLTVSLSWLIVSFMFAHTHLVPQDPSPLWKTWWCSVVSFSSNVDALLFFLWACLYPCYWKCDL